MVNTFTVAFSEEDLIEKLAENSYTMDINIITPPEKGLILVKSDGLFEIEHAINYSYDNKCHVFLTQIISYCCTDDIIVIKNKERMYRCVNEGKNYKRVTLFSMLMKINELTSRLLKVEKLLENVQEL